MRVAIVVLAMAVGMVGQEASGHGIVTLKPPPNCSNDPGVIRPCDRTDDILKVVDGLLQHLKEQQEHIDMLATEEIELQKQIEILENRVQSLEQKDDK